jgi:hypothetical protein
MWYKDTPGQQDKRTMDNKGFTSRKELTALSKPVQMMGKLHLDLFCQDKYLLNHVRGGSKIGKKKIFWRKIVIFHTKYPKNFRASLRNWKKYDFLT